MSQSGFLFSAHVTPDIHIHSEGMTLPKKNLALQTSLYGEAILYTIVRPIYFQMAPSFISYLDLVL